MQKACWLAQTDLLTSLDFKFKTKVQFSDGKPGPGFEKAGFGFWVFESDLLTSLDFKVKTKVQFLAVDVNEGHRSASGLHYILPKSNRLIKVRKRFHT